MELKLFIQETIENIVEGVVAAQSSIKDKGAEINPRKAQSRENGQWNNHNSGKLFLYPRSETDPMTDEGR